MSLRDYDKLTPKERRALKLLREPSPNSYEVPAHLTDDGILQLTRKCPEAPPDTRQDEKDSCQDNSVDAGVIEVKSPFSGHRYRMVREQLRRHCLFCARLLMTTPPPPARGRRPNVCRHSSGPCHLGCLAGIPARYWFEPENWTEQDADEAEARAAEIRKRDAAERHDRSCLICWHPFSNHEGKTDSRHSTACSLEACDCEGYVAP